MTNTGGTPAGWYHAPGDPEGTQRYWDGGQWIGDPQPVPQQSAPDAPAAPQAMQHPPATEAPPGFTPPAASEPSAGQPPAYGAPPASGQQPPAYGAPPASGQQPPAYGAPGASIPSGYTAFGDPGAAGVTGTLAEPWQRLVARLIDGILVAIVGGIVGIVVAIALDNTVGGIIAGAISLAIGVAYEIMLTSQMGATLGKKAFKMRIVNEADGSKVDDSVMLKRYMPSIVIGVLGLIPLIGVIFSGLLGLAFLIVSLIGIFSDEKRRSVYDKFGKTYVIVEG